MQIHEMLKETLEINTMEELAELIQAISKVKRYGLTEELKENLEEEVADVILMTSLIMNKYNLNSENIDKIFPFYFLGGLKMQAHEMLKETLEINAMEELAELIQVISKVKRYGLIEELKENLEEEVADVILMTSLIMNKYNLSSENMDRIITHKTNRLRKRWKESGGNL